MRQMNDEPERSLERYKICLVCACVPPAYSGAGNFLYKYAQRLERRSQLAFVLTHRAGRESYLDFQDQLQARKIVRVLPSVNPQSKSWLRIASRLWRCWFLLARVGWLLLTRRSQYDVVHVVARNWICWMGVLWGKVIGKKVVYETSLAGSDDLLTARQVGKPFEYWLLTRAHAYVAKSPLLYNLCRDAAIPEERLYLIPYSVDTNVYCPVDKADKVALRKKLNLPQEGPIIIFVGGILERKGADLIPPIFRGVLQTLPSACMLLVGPEDLPDEAATASFIRRELCECLTSGQLIFTGTVCNVQEYLQASDVFLFPSRMEGLPNVQLEAISCGLPSVVHNIEGITSYIVEDGVGGFIVHDENPAVYAKIIVRLLTDAAMYRDVSAKARQKALAVFAPEIVDQQYRLMYEELLGMRRQDRRY
jgi:glycosyltransferase involved in cell wall biosynthesis